MKLIYKIGVNKSNSCEVQPGEGQSSRADVMYTTPLSLEQKHLQTSAPIVSSHFQNHPSVAATGTKQTQTSWKYLTR